MTAAALCPCGSGRDYALCCGRYHAQTEHAPTAEALMRARYTAYVLGLEEYLRATWHPDTRPEALDLDVPPRPKWLGLSVKTHRPIDDSHATVEFVARYKLNGRAFRLHEISRFERVAGQWVYVNGEMKD